LRTTMVIAIDGPAGAGKSTVARETARSLGFGYLDSGAMYRAVALSLLEGDGDPAERAAGLTIELRHRVTADGRDATDGTRAPDAIELDTTDRPVEDVVGQVVKLVREAQK